MFMNESDLHEAQRLFGNDVHGGEATPNRATLAATVARLADWANENSDGWAYWAKPRTAAKRAVLSIYPITSADRARMLSIDATDAETAAALRTIKAFLTRQGVAYATRQHILTGRG